MAYRFRGSDPPCEFHVEGKTYYSLLYRNPRTKSRDFFVIIPRSALAFWPDLWHNGRDRNQFSARERSAPCQFPILRKRRSSSWTPGIPHTSSASPTRAICSACTGGRRSRTPTSRATICGTTPPPSPRATRSSERADFRRTSPPSNTPASAPGTSAKRPPP